MPIPTRRAFGLALPATAVGRLAVAAAVLVALGPAARAQAVAAAADR